MKLLLIGSLYGWWFGKESISSVRLFYLLAALIGLSGLVTYFTLTRDLFSEGETTLSCGFWLAMFCCLLTPISVMLLTNPKLKAGLDDLDTSLVHDINNYSLQQHYFH